MVLIKDVKLRIGDGRAKGDRVGSGNAIDRRPDSGFGRPIHIPKFAAAGEQLPGEVWGQGLSSAQDAQIAFSLPAALDEHSPCRWSGLHDRGSGLPKQMLKLAAIRGLFCRGHDDLCAAGEGKKKFENRDVERTGCNRQKGICRFDSRRFGHG